MYVSFEKLSFYYRFLEVMLRLKFRKKAFTLAETVIVCTIFAIMVVWIILWINRAFAFMNNTRFLVRATNFSREGVEMVYNLRDTNWRRCSGTRDKTWLYVWGSKGCKNIGADDMLKKWIYVIKEWTTWSSESFVYAEFLTWNSNFYELEWFFHENNELYRNMAKITFTWTYSYYFGGNIVTWSLDDLLFGVDFYRIVRVFGVYCKNSSNSNVTTSCSNDSDPKELRFCVKTFYTLGDGEHASELCSIMTNFME